MDSGYLDAKGNWSVPFSDLSGNGLVYFKDGKVSILSLKDVETELLGPVLDPDTPLTSDQVSTLKNAPTSTVNAIVGKKLTEKISFGSMSTQFRLVGINQDISTSHSNNILTFIAESYLDKIAMNSDNRNTNGYDSSATTMKTYLSDTLYNSMDLSWKKLIVPVTKEYGTSTTTKGTMINQTLWIPSMYEVGLSNTDIYEPDCGTTYSYFSDCPTSGASDKRKRGPWDNPISFDGWWLRSGCGQRIVYLFANVTSSGSLTFVDAYNSIRGVVPGFCC